MRKFPFFSAVLTLFLLVPASITWAQVTKTLNGVVRYESGMSKSTFTTPNGDVVVNLPQSLTGSVITGTVSIQPAGKTEKEKNRNLKELIKMVVNLDGQKIPLSATPTNFDWVTHLDRHQQTPVELLYVSGVKAFELSLPPVLSAPAIINAGNVPRFTTPSNVLVKGDALNIYTNQQFMPGEKFVLTDSKGQQFTVKPTCLSSNQAILIVPDKASVGEIKVRAEKGMTVPENFGAETIRYNMIDIDLSSPNTNLRPGEQSFVLAIISGLWEDHFVYSVDLRNLNPNTVTMEGGNLQSVNVNQFRKKLMEGEAARIEFQLSRTITGIKPGTFSVSATLHEDYNTSNDPFRPQLNVLKTPEDFNAWANALKKDLRQYATVFHGWDGDDGAGPVLNTGKNIQRAIDNMPACTSPGQLDESKAVAYSLLKPLHVPKGAAINWYSSFVAAKTAVTAIDNTLAGNSELIDNDVLRNGVEFAKRVTGLDIYQVQQLINIIQHTVATNENLQDLRNKINTLLAKTDAMRGSDPLLKYTMEELINSSYTVVNPAFNFKNTYISDVSFPVMDIVDRNTAAMISLKITPEKISYGTDKNKTQTPVQTKEKIWTVSNFKMEMGGLPVQNVTKVELPKFTVKTGTEMNQMPGIKFRVSKADIKPWEDWLNNFLKQGSNELKSGSVEYTGQNEEPIFTVSLDKVKPVNIQPEAGGNYTVTLQSDQSYLYYNPLPGFQFNANTSTYVANEIAGNPCQPEGSTSFTWLYIEKPCRIEMATTRASNIDPDAEDILNDIQDLLAEVSEDGAELGQKLAKTISIGKSFAVWMRVVRDWESYKAEYVCRNGVWQHGEMTLANSGVKEIVGWQLFKGMAGEDSWTDKDDMGWIRRNIPASISNVCNQAIR